MLKKKLKNKKNKVKIKVRSNNNCNSNTSSKNSKLLKTKIWKLMKMNKVISKIDNTCLIKCLNMIMTMIKKLHILEQMRKANLKVFQNKKIINFENITITNKILKLNFKFLKV